MKHEFNTLKKNFILIAVCCLFYNCSKDDAAPIQAGSWDVIGVKEKTLQDSLVSLDTFYQKLFFDTDGTGLKRHEDNQEDKILDWKVDSKKEYIEIYYESISETGDISEYKEVHYFLINEEDYQEWNYMTRVKPGGSTEWFDVSRTLYLTRIK